jgi:hypothetical protein
MFEVTTMNPEEKITDPFLIQDFVPYQKLTVIFGRFSGINYSGRGYLKNDERCHQYRDQGAVDLVAQTLVAALGVEIASPFQTVSSVDRLVVVHTSSPDAPDWKSAIGHYLPANEFERVQFIDCVSVAPQGDEGGQRGAGSGLEQLKALASAVGTIVKGHSGEKILFFFSEPILLLKILLGSRDIVACNNKPVFHASVNQAAGLITSLLKLKGVTVVAAIPEDLDARKDGCLFQNLLSADEALTLFHGYFGAFYLTLLRMAVGIWRINWGHKKNTFFPGQNRRTLEVSSYGYVRPTMSLKADVPVNSLHFTFSEATEAVIEAEKKNAEKEPSNRRRARIALIERALATVADTVDEAERINQAWKVYPELNPRKFSGSSTQRRNFAKDCREILRAERRKRPQVDTASLTAERKAA